MRDGFSSCEVHGMSVYVVAQLRFTNVSRYRLYQSRFAEVFAASGGRLLAADAAPTVLEGTWQTDKVVNMEFGSTAAAQSFFASPAHQAIAEDRHAGAQTSALLLRSLPIPH
jgi:uncharacterized protein (DUF1330 family)